MKKIFILIFTLASLSSFGQVYQNDGAYGRQYKRIIVDSTLHIPTFCGTPTRLDNVGNKAGIGFDSCNNKLYTYNPKDSTWSAVTGGSGSGITKLGTSPYGLVTINDSTYRVDTASISTILQAQHRIDSLAAAGRSELADTAAAVRAAGGGVSQSVISDTLNSYAAYGSLTTDNVIFSTPIALSVANHMMSGAFALKTQSGYTLIGRGSGSGVISALTSIDSNWIPTLHSEAYYNTKYLTGALTGWSTTGNSGTDTATKWIGTNDNNGLLFKVNGLKAGYLDTTSLYFGKGLSNVTGQRYVRLFDYGINLFVNGSGTQFLGIDYDATNHFADWSIYSNASTKARGNLVLGKLYTTTVTTGNIASQYESLLLQSNSYSGNAIESIIFNNTYGTNPKRMILYSGDGPISMLNGTGNLIIGKDRTGDVSSSKVTIVTTTQGSTPAPIMTTTQRNAIASPAEGLQVYDSTLHKLYVYDGTTWQAAW